MDFERFRLTDQELSIALEERPCDKCGACCRGFSIEIQKQDAICEPQLMTYAVRWEDVPENRKSKIKKSPFVLLSNGEGCPFLQHNKCRIYENRPEVCRKFPPSLLVCHHARLEAMGYDIQAFNQKAITINGGDPHIYAGVTFAINPSKLKNYSLGRGILKGQISIIELIDPEYFDLFRRCNLSAKRSSIPIHAAKPLSSVDVKSAYNGNVNGKRSSCVH